MKKLFICFFLILTTYLNAQKSFKGFGFFGSLTQSAHYYKNFDTDKKNNDSAFKYFPEYFYPQSHISKEFFNWGAGCFLELGKEKLRWQTELEYANKGANEMEVTEAISGERSPISPKAIPIVANPTTAAAISAAAPRIVAIA